MKTKLFILLSLIAVLQCSADLTVTITPGYSFGPDEVPTIDHLNQLGLPTVQVTGTLDGSTSLAAGSVNGTLLADTVPDATTIGFNASVPRGLQVLSAGIAGPGLTNNGVNTLAVSFNLTLGLMTITNVGQGTTANLLTVNTNWLVNYFYAPWTVSTWATNAPYYGTNNPWGFTNITAVTNIVFGTNPAPTLTAADVVPVELNQQGTNPAGVPLGVIERWITMRNMTNVAYLAFNNSNYTGNAFVTNAWQLNSLVLKDNTGSYPLINPGNPIVVNNGTNSTPLTTVLTNIANAINTTTAPANAPQFAATVSGTNVLVYEPLLFYPRATCTLTPGYAASLVTNIIVGSPTNTTLIYSNLVLAGTPTFAQPFAGGTNLFTGTVNSGQTMRVYYNTNSYAEIAMFSGSWTQTGGVITGFIGDTQTNVMATMGTNTTGGQTVPAQICTLPSNYGIYMENISGSAATYSFIVSHIPWGR